MVFHFRIKYFNVYLNVYTCVNGNCKLSNTLLTDFCPIKTDSLITVDVITRFVNNVSPICRQAQNKWHNFDRLNASRSEKGRKLHRAIQYIKRGMLTNPHERYVLDSFNCPSRVFPWSNTFHLGGRSPTKELSGIDFEEGIQKLNPVSKPVWKVILTMSKNSLKYVGKIQVFFWLGKNI